MDGVRAWAEGDNDMRIINDVIQREIEERATKQLNNFHRELNALISKYGLYELQDTIRWNGLLPISKGQFGSEEHKLSTVLIGNETKKIIDQFNKTNFNK